MNFRAFLIATTLLAGMPATAQADPVREPVLKQIQLPHNYYWRELYIPQLTTGPSSGAWMPDGKSVVYSMKGSLWRQSLDSDEAVELTHGPGYDYQPDVAPDGKSVVFARSANDSIQLVRLDLVSGEEQILTGGDGVYVEPRLSPDGKRILFTSSAEAGHFDLYVARLDADGLADVQAVVAGRKSKEDRYYYSAFDHAINASWSPDGKRIVFVSNPEIAWGTGDIWSIAIDDPKDAKRILTEETHWSTKPEIAHDGKRMLYVSYQGRQWQQLWLTNTAGKSPLPLTFGEFDRRNPRWSPDDKRILFTSNEGGNVSLWRLDFEGGKKTKIEPKRLKWKTPMATLTLNVGDDHGQGLPARISVKGADGRYYAPDDARIAADDYINKPEDTQAREYFICETNCAVTVPVGIATVMAQHGLAHKVARTDQNVPLDGATAKITLAANALPDRFGPHVSADLHVHMNYGGHYRQTLAGMAKQAQAEGLDIIYNLIVNKEQRFPDIAEWTTERQDIGATTVYTGQEYHTSFWGHLGLLHLDDHLLMPGFVSYRHTGLASVWPNNGRVSDLAHEQGALVGYVHPFDTPPETDKVLTNALPVDVALGRTDYLEIVSFAEHMETTKVWYRLLNLGFKLPAGAGTDAMTNYASLRGPVGLNRLYLDTDKRDPDSLKAAIKGGHGFATNGPLLGFKVNGREPGATITLKRPGTVQVDAALRSIVDAGQWELVYNGQVVKTLATTDGGMSGDATLSLPVTESGWLLLRAVNKTPSPWVQDLYPYATTNPVWIEVKGKPHKATADADYFIKWIDRIAETALARDDYNNEGERAAVKADLDRARKIFEGKK